MGAYIVTARRKGAQWYIGGMTDGTARDLEIDCSFLGDKAYTGDLFKDGRNAHRIGRDFKQEPIRLDRHSKLKLHLAPGGGFVTRPLPSLPERVRPKLRQCVTAIILSLHLKW